jgi:hypothetical protein
MVDLLRKVLMPDIASRLAPARLEQPELLDLGYGLPADVAENLHEMWRANRLSGGLRALTRHLYPRLTACKKSSMTLVDLGTGSAEIPKMIERWAQLHYLDVQIIAVDWAARNLAMAHRHIVGSSGISLLQADGVRLPFPPESVDFVISSLFLHHFPPDDVIQLLRSVQGHTRQGIIMTDLTRGWLPLVAFKLAQPIMARNFLTRYDGACSIRRAYTPDELRELAQAAGLPNVQVFTHWAWRMTLVTDR